MGGMRVSAEVKAREIQDYPGGYPAWHAAISAAATRQANARPVKPAVLGGGSRPQVQSTTATPKNAATGQIGGKTAGMNETERRYRDAYLVHRILAGEIAECLYEGVTLVLAWGPRREDRCTYTPDFWVRLADGRYESHEVKGPQVWDDSRVKFKVARELFPWVRFVWGQWRGGAWKIREPGQAQTLRA